MLLLISSPCQNPGLLGYVWQRARVSRRLGHRRLVGGLRRIGYRLIRPADRHAGGCARAHAAQQNPIRPGAIGRDLPLQVGRVVGALYEDHQPAIGELPDRRVVADPAAQRYPATPRAVGLLLPTLVDGATCT